MGCLSINERSRHKMNTEVQQQNTGKVIGLARSGCGLSVGILSKWKSGMESAAFDSQTWASELGNVIKVF